MPRYSAYGARDDRVQEDGDRGFVGFNNRLRPDQLKPGLLADSQNGRMGLNGQWEVRKGIDQILTPVTTSGALTIPCFIRDTTINSASINLNTPSSGNIQINFASAHGFTVGATGDIELTNLSGIDPAVADGPVPITVVDADSVKITDQTYTAAPSGTVVLGKLTIDDTAVEGLYGSCAFSDPNDSASQFIVLATNTKAIAFNLETLVSTDIAYHPTGVTVSSEVDMIQAFNKVFIFRDGQTALEWDGNTSNDFTKVTSGVFTQPLQINTSAKDCAFINDIFTFHTSQSFIVGQKIICTVNTNSGLQESKASGDVDRASFIINKVFTDSAAVGGGASSSPGLVRAGTTVTVTTASSHGLEINQPITIASSGTTEFNGNNVVASVPSPSSFTIELASAAGSDDTTGNATITPQAGVSFLVKENNINNIKTQAQVRAATPSFTKKVSVGLGFTHMPAPPFAIYHQRRLVMPFNYTVNDTADSFTANGKLDELIASDILDTNTYDQIYANFRFNAGTADFIVGLHSFSEDVLVVFNRNSIHLVANSQVLNNATARLLTDEIGCLARKSIQQIGNQILFLSDNGVYGVSFIDRKSVV